LFYCFLVYLFYFLQESVYPSELLNSDVSGENNNNDDDGGGGGKSKITEVNTTRMVLLTR